MSRRRAARRANDIQIGGDHYKGGIEPWDFILANNIPYMEATAIVYIYRWRKKAGIQDLKKAQHYLQKLIEHEEALAKKEYPR